MSESNGKPSKYYAEILIDLESTPTELTGYWKCTTEPCENAAKAKQELRKVAPESEFSWRIVKVAESGRSKIETSVKLTSV